MSASREKKQRQGASRPADKAAQARQEEAARKRKTITYTVIGVVVAVLVAALLIWSSGFFQRRATAATVGDTNISVAEMSYYYYRARSTYAAYGSIFGFDATKPDGEQVQDEETGATWRDSFLESALHEASHTVALYNAAVADGHTTAEVRDDVKAVVDSTKSSAAANGYNYASYLRAVYGEYMTPGAYEDLLARILLGEVYSNERSEQLADGYAQANLDAYYSENADLVDSFEYSYLFILAETVETKDADGNDLPEEDVNRLKEEAMAAAKSQAEHVQADYEDGSSIADLIAEFSPTTSADHATVTGSSRLNSVFADELLKLGKDESALVESSTGWYFIVFHSRGRDERPIANVRHILALAENGTGADGSTAAPTEEAWAAAQEKAQGILDQYKSGAQTADAFGALANEKSDDGDGTTGGLYEDIARDSSYVTEFKDWIFEDGRQVGDTGLVRHDGGTTGYSGYHVMYLDSFGEAEWAYAVRTTLTSQALNEWIEGLEDNYEAALAGGADYLGK